MPKTYRVLAYLIALEVALQAAFIAWGLFGLGRWIEAGNSMDKKTFDDRSSFHFTEERGFMFHGINGQMVIPLLAIALMVVALVWRGAGAVRWAGIVLALVIVQVVLGMAAASVTFLGALHGLNALLVFGAAVMAGTSVVVTPRSSGSASQPA